MRVAVHVHIECFMIVFISPCCNNWLFVPGYMCAHVHPHVRACVNAFACECACVVFVPCSFVSCVKVLKHGGALLLRDYAANDLAQNRLQEKGMIALNHPKHTQAHKAHSNICTHRHI